MNNNNGTILYSKIIKILLNAAVKNQTLDKITVHVKNLNNYVIIITVNSQSNNMWTQDTKGGFSPG